MTRTSLLLSGLLLLASAGNMYAQGEFDRMRRGFGGGDPNEFYTPPEFHGNPRYDGRFVFARIKYRGYAHFTREGPGWAHDYPRSDSHLMRIMQEITTLRPFIEQGDILGGSIVALDDPQLFKYPVAYFSEPGGWFPTDGEVAGLRKYWLKGGFVIFDDFGGSRDMMNTMQQLQRVFPNARPIQLDGSHPIFDAFYKIDLNALGQTYRGTPVYFGLFQDNDPKKRMYAILNYDNDIGEYWEYSDQGYAPVAVSNEAYKLGVNYLIYALTH